MSDNINSEFQNTQERQDTQRISVEEKARECLNQKYALMDRLDKLTKSRQLSVHCLDTAKDRLSKTPHPQPTRVFSIIVFAVVALRILAFLSSQLRENNASFAYVMIGTVPVYLVMVGLLAKSCKRSAALTWFNLLTFGVYGAIFALSSFVKSFSIDVASIEKEVHCFDSQLRMLESEINATKRELQRIEDEINILSLTK